MSPLARRLAFSLTLVALVPLHGASHAQTIADYSRTQRALLESTMSQAAARSAGLGASAPAAPAASTVAMPVAALPRLAVPPLAPTLLVSGVFASHDGAVAEVLVNGTAYLLAAAHGVPGTAWRVESIEVDRVVLARPGRTWSPEAEGTRKVFALPELR